MTCRWLAGMITRAEGPDGPVALRVIAPITGRRDKAYEELIAEELDAAVSAMSSQSIASPDFVAGVCATLSWTWQHSGRPPIEVEQPDVRRTAEASHGRHAAGGDSLPR
ncbi:hypothetical protein AB0E63_28040 [Kribbella sp. NPDC026596]|uniref:hypothetical protein n=1 Tax=Kribbella sp. NPDC026596 TaxID=3155122 RepID=UPI0034067B6A